MDWIKYGVLWRSSRYLVVEQV